MQEEFQVQIASDLHIEFKNNDVPNPLDYITPTAPNLILAGDIGTFYKYDQLFGFLNRLSPLFTHIIYVFGNHEYYMQKHSNGENYTPLTIGDIKKLSQKLQKDIPNLCILDNSAVRIGNYSIIGSTLWSNIQVGLPKYIVKIYGMTTKIYSQKFESSVKYLKDELQRCKEKGRKAIVVTHYVPTFSVLPEERLAHKYISLYASDLEYLFEDHVDTWICGHVHHNFDVKINKTRLVANQRGKPRDNIQNYSKDFTLTF
jgi:predicted phosphohydrolase